MTLLRSFYSPSQPLPEKKILLDSTESSHLIKVRRAKKDEIISVFDGRGNEWLCTVERFDPVNALLNILEHKTTRHNFCSVNLIQALPKGKVIEGIIQKATEIGANQLTIFLAERSERSLTSAQQATKREKWHSIAVESCKQCGMNFVPEIIFKASLSAVLSEINDQALKLIASLEKNALSLRSSVQRFFQKNKQYPPKVYWLVGPEGDFSYREYVLAAQAGFQPISLGPNVLRVETAATVSLGLLMNELRELENTSST